MGTGSSAVQGPCRGRAQNGAVAAAVPADLLGVVGAARLSPEEIMGTASGWPPAASTPRFTTAKWRWRLLKSEAVCAIPATGLASIALE